MNRKRKRDRDQLLLVIDRINNTLVRPNPKSFPTQIQT